MITSKNIKVNSTITLLQETLLGIEYYTLIDTKGKYNLLFNKQSFILSGVMLTCTDVLSIVYTIIEYSNTVKLKFNDYNAFATILSKKYKYMSIFGYTFDRNIIDDRTYKLIIALNGDCDISDLVQESIVKSVFEITIFNLSNTIHINNNIAFTFFIWHYLGKKLKLKFNANECKLKFVCDGIKDFYKLINFFDILNI